MLHKPLFICFFLLSLSNQSLASLMHFFIHDSYVMDAAMHTNVTNIMLIQTLEITTPAVRSPGVTAGLEPGTGRGKHSNLPS